MFSKDILLMMPYFFNYPDSSFFRVKHANQVYLADILFIYDLSLICVSIMLK